VGGIGSWLAIDQLVDSTILEYEERMKNENVLRKLLVLRLLDFPLLFWRLASSLSPCLVTSWVPVGSSCGKSFTRERTSIGPSEREGGGERILRSRQTSCVDAQQAALTPALHKLCFMCFSSFFSVSCFRSLPFTSAWGNV